MRPIAGLRLGFLLGFLPSLPQNMINLSSNAQGKVGSFAPVESSSKNALSELYLNTFATFLSPPKMLYERPRLDLIKMNHLWRQADHRRACRYT